MEHSKESDKAGGTTTCEKDMDIWQIDFLKTTMDSRAPCVLFVMDVRTGQLLGHRPITKETSSIAHALSPIFRRYGLPERILVDCCSQFPTGEDQQTFQSTMAALGVAVHRAAPSAMKGRMESLMAQYMAGRANGK